MKNDNYNKMIKEKEENEAKEIIDYHVNKENITFKDLIEIALDIDLKNITEKDAKIIFNSLIDNKFTNFKEIIGLAHDINYEPLKTEYLNIF